VEGVKVRFLTKLAVAFLIVCTCAAYADTLNMSLGILTVTSDGTLADPNEWNDIGDTLIIPKHPAWDGPLAGSQWVSHTFQTGDPNAPDYIVVPNTVGPEDTGTGFYNRFFVPGAPVGGMLWVFADDSTSVLLNGVFLMHEAPMVGNGYGACSDTATGCKNTTIGDVNLAPALQAGWNTLEFHVAQRAAVSYGLDYAATIDFAPEPATFAVMGGALLALGALRRKLAR
jgi:hypothetical protein